MPEMLILAHVSAPDATQPLLEDYATRSSEQLSKVSGYIAHSFWAAENAFGEYLVIYRYADIGAAAKGLETLTDSGLLIEALEQMREPADVHRMAIEKHSGMMPDDAELGSFISLSYRLAEPGQSDGAVDEICYIFQELATIPGFHGWACGRSDAVEEQVTGVALWATHEGFEQSMPKHSLHKVTLYRKIA